jgi:hypothetical protein
MKASASTVSTAMSPKAFRSFDRSLGTPRLPKSKRDVQNVGDMETEQDQKHHEPGDPEAHRRPALPEPSRTKPACKEKKG